jgi:hypothetical protein
MYLKCSLNFGAQFFSPPTAILKTPILNTPFEISNSPKFPYTKNTQYTVI